MKIRTVYLVTRDMDLGIKFWSSVLNLEPTKRSPYWSEFKCENINLGLLGESFDIKGSGCVPVFEVDDSELETLKSKALSSGASLVLDIKDHPDKKSYVLADPFGNEFEITKFHDNCAQ